MKSLQDLLDAKEDCGYCLGSKYIQSVDANGDLNLEKCLKCDNGKVFVYPDIKSAVESIKKT
jgi:hypothetical protein